jgi:hemerythrin-like metal-binding protein
MTTYPYVLWKDFYSVGEPVLDSQHKQIIELINRLYAAVREGTENRVSKEVLERLTQYTLNHFHQEEELMKQSGYPGSEAHKARHAEMKQRTLDLRTHLSLVTARDVLHFLKTWWTEHIQREDKKYATHLRAAATR